MPTERMGPPPGASPPMRMTASWSGSERTYRIQVCGAKMRPNGKLPSDQYAARRTSDTGASKKGPSPCPSEPTSVTRNYVAVAIDQDRHIEAEGLDAFRVDEIVTGTRLRGLDSKAVGVLKESIKVIGLKVPISVRYLSDEEGYALVAGAHRLQACIELGMEEIPVQEEEGSELDARLWEIDENLCRSELTELERGEHLVTPRRQVRTKRANTPATSYRSVYSASARTADHTGRRG
jgi:uncharacterized ParB-like nuclease family protein